MTKFYTGVSSRGTPGHILELMRRLANKLQSDGWILRSGGADGADSAFEHSACSCKEIYYAADANKSAMNIASKFHPAWHRCSPYVKKLHGRNAFQVLGAHLNQPSSMLICWTKDGCLSHENRSIETGGTGTAISIADWTSTEVINLSLKDHYDRAIRYLE